MPLVIVCGLPCSGKTAVAEAVAAHLREARGAEVVVVNEEALGLSRSRVYSSAAEEKRARSALRAAVERSVSRRVTVVADTEANHIKGMRYELHCRAREAQTPHCTVFVDTPPDECRRRNEAREEGSDGRYEEKAMEDLLVRLEVPDGARRWDKPLFVVPPGAQPPLEAVAAAALDGKPPQQSLATVPQGLAGANDLHELDRVTQEVVHAVAAEQRARGAMPGDRLRVPHTDERFLLSRAVSLPELRRLRHQFLRIAQLGAGATRAEAAASFVAYLNTNT